MSGSPFRAFVRNGRFSYPQIARDREQRYRRTAEREQKIRRGSLIEMTFMTRTRTAKTSTKECRSYSSQMRAFSQKEQKRRTTSWRELKSSTKWTTRMRLAFDSAKIRNFPCEGHNDPGSEDKWGICWCVPWSANVFGQVETSHEKWMKADA